MCIDLIVAKNGDVNGDGDTKISDAMLLANYVTWPSEYVIYADTVAEVSGDGELKISDAMLLANYVTWPDEYVLR